MMKGGTVVPIFGLSVDAVPTVRSGKVRFARLPHKSKFDILFNLAGRFGAIDHMHGPDRVVHDAHEILPLYVKEAAGFWSAHSKLHRVGDAVRAMERSLRDSDGLQYENYVQPRLARPFLLALGGASSDAQQHWATLRETLKAELSSTELDKLERAFEKTNSAGRMSC